MIPPEANAAFVAGMEDVLEVYHRPHDPACPLVCVDEATKQLIKETRVPVPAKPGQPARYDFTDLTETPDGLRVLIRYSRTDQEGQGQEVAIPRGYGPQPDLKRAEFTAAECTGEAERQQRTISLADQCVGAECQHAG